MNPLIQSLEKLAPRIGKSPLMKLDAPNINLMVKLEYTNLTGSVKDRPAYNILYEGIRKGQINEDTIIMESSSGNFAIALATICRELGLRFIPVIDPNINEMNEEKLRGLAYDVVKVQERDETGGFLLTRLRYIHKYMEEHPGIYWTNQYANKDNYMSYYHTLAPEIAEEAAGVDYLFAAVSSGGTITGLSIRLKELYPHIKVIGVDVEGSVIFGSPPKPRQLSGIGSSKVPPILSNALIDEVMIISEEDIRKGARELYATHGVYGGASCGAAYFAVCSYFHNRKFFRLPNVVFICPDHGHTYQQVVYEQALSGTVSL
ncbi:pyridoxal-phosphate dependent enzyme [Chitinophaga solisilvae]|uniref:Pyridoxal-phosphate dependent enzyme n=1 Tax=Chitinophaga solisilvae TaxID=1233460 RepID=A0A9Q5DB92_9BACT|nr:pyridoxal-phosphate dependent enzyme [Chitinophaga solisilvae]NSL87210.1 pyridoxal-phosphate dependent enzyme [Chitinophaga solisilvae]